MSTQDANEALLEAFKLRNEALGGTAKGIAVQIGLMSGISVRRDGTRQKKHWKLTAQVATVLAFSFLRPRDTKVYAPKVRPVC